MKTTTLGVGLVGALTLVCGNAVMAEAEKEEDKLSVAVSLNHDAFFGFNPFVGVTYATDSNYDLTFYGIQWGAGTGRDWGNWTEAGFGFGFEALDGALYVNPQLGFTFGSLLSSNAAEDGVVGDGIVPNLTVNLDHEGWEGQLYAGWYKDLRDNARAGGTTAEFVHYWINGGRQFGQYFSAGLHFEELRLSGGSNISGAIPGYRWLGPYVQVAKDNAGMRFSFGADLTEDATSFSDNDFYKLQVFFNF